AAPWATFLFGSAPLETARPDPCRTGSARAVQGGLARSGRDGQGTAEPAAGTATGTAAAAGGVAEGTTARLAGGRGEGGGGGDTGRDVFPRTSGTERADRGADHAGRAVPGGSP